MTDHSANESEEKISDSELESLLLTCDGSGKIAKKAALDILLFRAEIKGRNSVQSLIE